MVNEKRKIWAHYEQLKSILGHYITLFFTVPVFSLGFSYLAHSKEIDSGVQDAVKMAMLIGLKWYAITMLIVTVLFIIWAFYYSDTVECTENTIKYYRWISSKESRNISYNECTKCVFSDGLWQKRGEYVRGRKVRIFNKSNIILEMDLYYKLCLSLILKLSIKKIWLIDDDLHLRTIDNYFKIEFTELPYEQQQALLKYYCKLTRTKYKTGEEILANIKMK